MSFDLVCVSINQRKVFVGRNRDVTFFKQRRDFLTWTNKCKVTVVHGILLNPLHFFCTPAGFRLYTPAIWSQRAGDDIHTRKRLEAQKHIFIHKQPQQGSSSTSHYVIGRFRLKQRRVVFLPSYESFEAGHTEVGKTRVLLPKRSK